VARQLKQPAADNLDSLPALPITVEHWQAIVRHMGLSGQQARIVELVLRCATQRQIATTLGITEPTLKTYMQRIFARTGTRGRMHLVMHVFALSHNVVRRDACHQNR
jgi:DNA-binding CsgD family transcriptional regulator